MMTNKFKDLFKKVASESSDRTETKHIVKRQLQSFGDYVLYRVEQDSNMSKRISLDYYISKDYIDSLFKKFKKHISFIITLSNTDVYVLIKAYKSNMFVELYSFKTSPEDKSIPTSSLKNCIYETIKEKTKEYIGILPQAKIIDATLTDFLPEDIQHIDLQTERVIEVLFDDTTIYGARNFVSEAIVEIIKILESIK